MRGQLLAPAARPWRTVPTTQQPASPRGSPGFTGPQELPAPCPRALVTVEWPQRSRGGVGVTGLMSDRHLSVTDMCLVLAHESPPQPRSDDSGTLPVTRAGGVVTLTSVRPSLRNRPQEAGAVRTNGFPPGLCHSRTRSRRCRRHCRRVSEVSLPQRRPRPDLSQAGLSPCMERADSLSDLLTPTLLGDLQAEAGPPPRSGPPGWGRGGYR